VAANFASLLLANMYFSVFNIWKSQIQGWPTLQSSYSRSSEPWWKYISSSGFL